MPRLEGYHTPSGYYLVLGAALVLLALLLLQYFGYLSFIPNFGLSR